MIVGQLIFSLAKSPDIALTDTGVKKKNLTLATQYNLAEISKNNIPASI